MLFQEGVVPEAEAGTKYLVGVKLKTSLSEEKTLAIAHERAPAFRAIPGLIQKYLARTIPTAYKVVEPPVVEVGEVMFPLRD